MLKVRYIVRLVTAFIKRFKGVIIISSLLGVVLFFITGRFIPKLVPGSITRIGITGRYHTNELPNFVLSKISSGLTKLNEQGLPEPDLAESWETPDKGKTWIFNLRDDIYWQDGDKITSSSIIYEFSDVKIERPNDKQIVFKLEDAYAPFPVVVSRPTFKIGLLGTKDWRVEEASLISGYVEKLSILNTNNEMVVYKFFPTFDRTILAYKLGEVDKIVNMLDPAPFNTWMTAKVEANLNKSQIVTLFFNTKDEMLSDKTLRQALVYAINKETFKENRAISPIAPDSWAYNPQVKTYGYDPNRAKEIFDDLPNEVKEKLDIKIISSPALLDLAEKISDDWSKVGVKSSVLVSSVIPEEFQAYLTIFDIPKDPDQYAVWHSTQTQSNISKYSSPRIDKLLEDGRSTLDQTERKKIYLDFQRFLLEDVPAGFLYHPYEYSVSRR
jgi:peptide/nickel transport system substrate-binding protein